MLQTSQIEHAHATVSSTTDEHINTAGAEAHIKDLFVVCDQLSFRSKGWDIPDGAGRVNARRDYKLWGQGIPIERGQWSSMFGGL